MAESCPLNVSLSCDNGLNIARLNLIEINIKTYTWLQQISHTPHQLSSFKSTKPFSNCTVNILKNAGPANLHGPHLAPSCARTQLIHFSTQSVTSSPELSPCSCILAEHLSFGFDHGLPSATVISFPLLWPLQVHTLAPLSLVSGTHTCTFSDHR